MTEYIILELGGEAGAWREFGKSRASSPQRALRSLDLRAGTYVAVPFRSWKPLTVKVEQTTKVTIT